MELKDLFAITISLFALGLTGLNFVASRRNDIRKTFGRMIDRQSDRVEEQLKKLYPLAKQIDQGAINDIWYVFIECHKEIEYILDNYEFLQKPRYLDTIHAERRICREWSALWIESETVKKMLEELQVAARNNIPFDPTLTPEQVREKKVLEARKIGNHIGRIDRKLIKCIDLARMEVALGERPFRWAIWPNFKPNPS